MNKNEVKKLLYKENPIAGIRYVRDGVIHYICSHIISKENNEVLFIIFKVPMNDTFGGDFLGRMDSKHLIKWIDSWE